MKKKSEILKVTECNRLAWDASAALHQANPEWSKLVAGFANPSFSILDCTLTSILKDIPITDKSVVQIGCNNGRELLSTIALGARSGLGIDQSTQFIEHANYLSGIAGTDCKFLASNIYDLPPDTPRNFDVALITIGVLNWMPDIELFFQTVSKLLAPSGKLVIYETHPFLEMFDPRDSNPQIPSISYFLKSPYISEEAIVYDDSQPTTGSKSYWYIHRLGEIVTACIQSGLSLDNIVEYPHSIRETEYDLYADQDAQLPMCFSLVATKN